ncbi:MAG: FliA/WhiG family RNA polymerase sigma factor [Magnetococcales bacterium]|nr:FliA/WhiG family RNA polymerase sigma factor [Magnetococcales bacterium]MBF0418997.1 FliA/WhiG family RNA polymerase sigma factor [Magnetococcales bacterium]MBF0435294.1 FliA/WhiG family RNA polymerase sigma factor [Magnetococcales bacterium]
MDAGRIRENVESWEGMSRDDVIIKYAPMVKYVASRISMKLPQSVDIDDLIQVGVLGLIDAVAKFDPNRGIKFQTYAEFRVRGAILDELRAMDWVPRAVRQVSGHIQSVYQQLEGELGRPAEDEEVANRLQITLNEFYEQLDSVRGISILSFEDIRPSLEEEEWDILEILADPDVEDPLESIGLQEMRLAMSEAIDSLPEKERLVLTLYYYEELTMCEIGEVLGLTESRISQLHSKAALRMRAKMRRVLGKK